MSDRDHRDDEDWVDRLTALAKSLGMNEIRVRWKLEALRKKLQSTRFRAEEQVEHVRYEHKICPSCGRLNDGDLTTCARCGEPLGGKRWHMLQRLGLALPSFMSVSSLLGTALVVVYGRVLLGMAESDAPMAGVLSIDTTTLVRFGGSWPTAVLEGGEWWRLGTCIFLHAGLWHLGFNLLALSMIGPTIEEIFGRGRMLLFFMVTGLLASLGSVFVGGGVSIGASGAVLGLIGLAAGWGHRDGTTIGKSVRSQMVKWLLYTMVFGVFIGADHTAHLVGFLSGGLIGLIAPPQTLKRSVRVPVVVLQSGLGAALALAFVIMCLIPMPSRAPERFARELAVARREISVEAEQQRICDLVESGRTTLAWYEAPSIHYPDLSDAESQRRVIERCSLLDAEREARAASSAPRRGHGAESDYCARLRNRGIEPPLAPGASPREIAARAALESQLRALCAATTLPAEINPDGDAEARGDGGAEAGVSDSGTP